MKLRTITFTVACLALATGAKAEMAQFAARIAFPIPAGDVGDRPLGFDVGLSLDGMRTSYVGVGVDLVYHYWPASPDYMAAYDRYLRDWFQTFDGSTWGFSAIQFSAHLKLVGPTVANCTPWAQIGAGLYRVDHNLADPNWEGASIIVVKGGPKRTALEPGWHGRIGVDFPTSPTMALGVDATYDVIPNVNRLETVWGDPRRLPAFSAVTVGAHVRFGR